jgi:hypothetical protein
MHGVANMNMLKTVTAGLLLASACASVSARLHQVCYQVPGANQTGRAAFGCQVDGPGWCQVNTPISGSTGGTLNSAAHPPGGPMGSAGGSFWVYNMAASGTYTSRIDFFDGAGTSLGSRNCTVNITGLYYAPSGSASPGAELTSFSTDASGLVTTGVWKLTASYASNWRRQDIAVPADYVVVGGGAIGAQTPAGAMIATSQRMGDREWQARSSDLIAPNPHQQSVYAIGMRIEGVRAADLAAMLIRSFATSYPTIAPHPSTQAIQGVIGGSVVLSGSVNANADPSNSLNMLGQFLTVSAPVIGQRLQCSGQSGVLNCTAVTAVTGWRAESKDHGNAHPGWISTETLEMPLTVNVGGASFEVRGKHVQAQSGVASHPAIDATGLRGEYALTGIGAAVDWRNHGWAGNLLWKLEPRADLGGASVSAKDHIWYSPATVTGYALGIKLVPVGTPPEGSAPLCRFDKFTGQLICF